MQFLKKLLSPKYTNTELSWIFCMHQLSCLLWREGRRAWGVSGRAEGEEAGLKVGSDPSRLLADWESSRTSSKLYTHSLVYKCTGERYMVCPILVPKCHSPLKGGRTSWRNGWSHHWGAGALTPFASENTTMLSDRGVSSRGSHQPNLGQREHRTNNSSAQ